MKINLGCGRDYKIGWKNWDISHDVRCDDIVDVRRDRFPTADQSVEEIYCSGVLEQILQNENLVHCMNECHRVMQNDGLMTIVVPNSKFSISFKDPHDCRHFLAETWNYFDSQYDEFKKYGSVYGYMPWTVMSRETNDRGIMTVVLKKVC